MYVVVASIAGIVGVVGSLFFAGWSTHELARQTRMQNLLAEASQVREPLVMLQTVLAMLIERPQLRKYFYDNAPCPTDADERARVLTLCELLADAFSSGLHTSTLIDDMASGQGWRNYAGYVLSHSPAMVETLRGHEDWWPSLVRILDRSNQPPTRDDPSPTDLG